MAGRSVPEWSGSPDLSWYNRAPLRAANPGRALQMNCQHLANTRVRQLVADTDIFYEITTGAIAGKTDPEYYVCVSPNATRLWATIAWFGVGGGEAEDYVINVQCYSERGGAGVAAAQDQVTSSPVITDRLTSLGDTPGYDPFNNHVIKQRTGGRANVAYYGKILGVDGVGMKWIDWSPNLTTSNEQRVVIQTQDVGNVGEHVGLWGVWIFELTPQAV